MDIKKYREWIIQSDFYYRRFSLLAEQLTTYILDNLSDHNISKEIASKFGNVIASCDEIDYEDDITATAYGIIHFLPRFRRFQLTFSKLIDKKILPYKNRSINSLDIGTGPGPSLFALSDAYYSLHEFEQLCNIHNKKEFQYIPDYVEKSNGFRNWLHHFTEIANYKTLPEKTGWDVPFHHGSFFDFNDISFNQNYQMPYYDDEGFLMFDNKVIKHRFDVIISSNFFTTVSQVDAQKNQLQNCMRFMRNGGKMMISGGTGTLNHDKNYPKIYDKLKEIITENVYGNHIFFAKATYIKINRNKLSFDLSDRFGNIIKDFNRKIYEKLKEHNALESIPLHYRKLYENSVKDEYNYTYKWEFHVFEKSAQLKRKKYRHKFTR